MGGAKRRKPRSEARTQRAPFPKRSPLSHIGFRHRWRISWLSLTAPTDALKKCLFCEVRQGGGAYGKSASGAAFSGFLFFAHMSCGALSPESMDKA
ncbi:hypothetical protein C1C20_24055 [Salmonella enterica subsp. enterica serovar Gaminara]|nr:hypothetical protein [Salmonella enterica subsp. enterica serovar Gaminara]